MKNLILPLVACFGLYSSAYAAPHAMNLEGIYDCNSVEVGTHENSKGVMRVKQTGDTYTINSTFTDGSTYTGTGIYDQVKQVFSVAFINPQKAEESGIIIADVKPNNDLKATWTYLNQTTLGQGACTKRA